MENVALLIFLIGLVFVGVGIVSATDTVCPARPAVLSFHRNLRTTVVVMHNNKMVLDWIHGCNVKIFNSHFKSPRCLNNTLEVSLMEISPGDEGKYTCHEGSGRYGPELPECGFTLKIQAITQDLRSKCSFDHDTLKCSDVQLAREEELQVWQETPKSLRKSTTKSSLNLTVDLRNNTMFYATIGDGEGEKCVERFYFRSVALQPVDSPILPFVYATICYVLSAIFMVSIMMCVVRFAPVTAKPLFWEIPNLSSVE